MILSRPQVLTIGYFTTDLLVKVDRFADIDDEVPIQTFGEYQGGSAANTAVGVRRLGVPGALLTCVGNDELARKGLRILASEDVDISRVATSRKGLGSPYVVGIVDPQGERQLYSYGGAAQELTPDQLTREDLADVTHLHICTLGPEFVERALKIAGEADHRVTISADPGALGCAGERATVLRPLLPRLDLLFLNTVEMGLLINMTDVRQLPVCADALPPRVAIKLGAKGCVLYERGAALTFAPAFKVDAIDTTGAGDAFAAGHLVGWIHGLVGEGLATFSNAVAALSTRVHGCRDGLPTMNEVTAFLRVHCTTNPIETRMGR